MKSGKLALFAAGLVFLGTSAAFAQVTVDTQNPAPNKIGTNANPNSGAGNNFSGQPGTNKGQTTSDIRKSAKGADRPVDAGAQSANMNFPDADANTIRNNTESRGGTSFKSSEAPTGRMKTTNSKPKPAKNEK